MSKPLNDHEIRDSLENLDGWKVSDNKLTKEFTFSDFRQAVAFMVRVGFEAEEQGHHPEFFNVYNNVTIRLSTHDAGGRITSKDVKLAGSIDTL
jgi:4a-hydroxytetrahydrobiopterin dehydratase